MLYSSGVLAKTIHLKTYYTPATAGIVWVTVYPSYLDYRKYKADFTINFGGSVKRFRVNKSGSHPITVGIPHWNNNSKKVTVSKQDWGRWSWYKNNTSIYKIKQGALPSFRYQTIQYWKK